MQEITREQVVASARQWLGTPFKHQGRTASSAQVKGGCDCIGLVLGVVENIYQQRGIDMLCPQRSYLRKNTEYGRLPDGQKLKSGLEQHLHPVSVAELKPADILLCRLDGNPQHVALVTEYAYGGLGMIHAYAQAHKVVENRLDDMWQSSVVSAYSFRAFASLSS